MVTNIQAIWCLTGTMEYVISISISFSSWLCTGFSWFLLVRWSFFSSPASAGSIGRISACSLQLCDSTCIWTSNLSSSAVSSFCRTSRNNKPAEIRSSDAQIPDRSTFHKRKTPVLSFMFVSCSLVLHCRVIWALKFTSTYSTYLKTCQQMIRQGGTRCKLFGEE